ncbi:DUF819 family protein [Lewinella sp. 4G2]|uniref:DUF819 family protein n=1 Tax=Lewinella sp. 4G2 TaxID=1803372 RepID=UPI0007B4E3B3|nr:DUF819 family protein [Lewinella sp. 4G2]OAV45413.1 hypothetical protein A3850_013325 [Lewinella sp. 4G2]
MSSIIACYLIGIAVSNGRVWAVDNNFLENVAAASMVIGLPLLLLGVRIQDSLKYARPMLLAFGLCCFSGLLCTGLVGYYMAGEFPDAWKVSGMLTGLYTGGTPNVQAIGLALDAPADYLVLVQAADVLLGGAYLLGLITFLPAIYARFYRKTPGEEEHVEIAAVEKVAAEKQLAQTGVALAIVAISAGVTFAVTGGLDNVTLLILSLTTLALVAASMPITQRLGNTYPLGEYFILVFSVALGLMADFRELAANGMDLLYFSFLALSSTTLLHLLLCRLFNVDRDTVILSSVAGFYGPVFVVQVAAALKNKRLMAAGLAVSLLGFGIGNYLGVSVANLIRYLA